jgi:hypothetical protein
MGRLKGDVLASPVSRLYAAGFPIHGQQVDSACPACGCPLGDHELVLPGGTTAADLLDRAGWIECPGCDDGCGNWVIQLPGW